MVMNLQDSSWHHHPITTRGFLETVNWNLKGAGILKALFEPSPYREREEDRQERTSKTV
jgi:hypothetical protein